MEFFQNLWTRTSLIGRGIFIGACVLIIALCVGLFIWANKVEYQPLFSNMAGQDVSKVVSILEKQKIPYEVAADGQTILVDKNIVYKTRMQLMGDGLALNGGIGLELFNNAEFGVTEFAQRVNYQRALQGELARTITGFDEIQAARVLLVLPESGLLRRRGTHAKASVWVTLGSGKSLHPDQVAGIQRLVAASVPEIEPSFVTVVDQKGVALSVNNQYRDGFYVGNANLQLKKEIETYFAQKVAEVLDEIVGVGKAAIAIDVTLDYDQVQTTRERVLPAASNDKTGVLIRQRERSSAPPPIFRSSTINSTDNIVPPLPPEQPVSKMVESDYQTGKEIQQVMISPGTIKRLSVGIVMPKKLSEQTIEHIQKVVTMAVGLDPERGDAIAFSALDPLNPPVIEQDVLGVQSDITPQKTAVFLTNEQIITGAIALLIMLCLFIGTALLLRSRQPSKIASLSQSEKERLLVHVKQWLADDDPSAEPKR